MSRPLATAMLGALAAAALGCGSERPGEAPAEAGTLQEIRLGAGVPEDTGAPAAARRGATPEAPGAPAATERAPAATPPAPAAEEIAPVPLERLLALPPDRGGAAPPDLAELLQREVPGAPVEEAAASPGKLRFDLDKRTDAPIERRDLRRDQVNAGLAVDVGNDTSLRGGVRVQRDTATAVEPSVDTAPSIGIEKRF